MGDGCDMRMLTREGDTLQAALDQLEAIDQSRGGCVLRDESGRPRCYRRPRASAQRGLRLLPHSGCEVSAKSVCGAEIGGVTVIWMASRQLPVRATTRLASRDP